MPQQYDDTDKGVLFYEEERKSERHPNWTGKINVGGQEFRLAGWGKRTDSGKALISLKVSEFQEKRPQQQADFDDDIPF